MLRYGMSHKDAAENLSFPAAKINNNNKPIIAFTSTRWNSLQNGIFNDDNNNNIKPPTSADCLSFVFGSSTSSTLTFPMVEAVLHSARDEEELVSSMKGIRLLSEEEIMKWREYGQIFENANDDHFDEYPEERNMK